MLSDPKDVDRKVNAAIAETLQTELARLKAQILAHLARALEIGREIDAIHGGGDA